MSINMLFYLLLASLFHMHTLEKGSSSCPHFRIPSGKKEGDFAEFKMNSQMILRFLIPSRSDEEEPVDTSGLLCLQTYSQNTCRVSTPNENQTAAWQPQLWVMGFLTLHPSHLHSQRCLCTTHLALSSTEWYHLTWCQRLCGVVRSRGHFYDLVLMAWAALVFISWKAIPWKKHQQNRPFIYEAALMGGNALLCPRKPARLIWNSFSIFPQIFKSQNIEFKLWYSSVPAFQR